MKNRVLVVETGGTFATSSTGSVRTLSSYGSSKGVYSYGRVTERVEDYEIEFEVIRPIFTLSENLNMELLNKLLDALYNIDFKRYKGVIIVHGTDTLAFTANIVSMLFSHRGTPVVFVSSNHPLNLGKSNGVDNFAAALDFIFGVGIQGVYVVYKNYEGKIEIHLGSRVKQMDQVVDAYESFKNVAFGIMANKEFVRNLNRANPSIEEIGRAKSLVSVDYLQLEKRVMLIYPYVGMRHGYYNFQGIDGVVYGVYHSGTFFTESDYPNNSINKLIERLAKLDIPLFIPELCSQGEIYESAANLAEGSKVCLAYDISMENLYAKALVGLELYSDYEKVNNFVNCQNIFFEKVKM